MLSIRKDGTGERPRDDDWPGSHHCHSSIRKPAGQHVTERFGGDAPIPRGCQTMPRSLSAEFGILSRWLLSWRRISECFRDGIARGKASRSLPGYPAETHSTETQLGTDGGAPLCRTYAPVLDCANGRQKENHEEAEDNCPQEGDTNEGEETF